MQVDLSNAQASVRVSASTRDEVFVHVPRHLVITYTQLVCH